MGNLLSRNKSILLFVAIMGYYSCGNKNVSGNKEPAIVFYTPGDTLLISELGPQYVNSDEIGIDPIMKKDGDVVTFYSSVYNFDTKKYNNKSLLYNVKNHSLKKDSTLEDRGTNYFSESESQRIEFSQDGESYLLYSTSNDSVISFLDDQSSKITIAAIIAPSNKMFDPGNPYNEGDVETSVLAFNKRKKSLIFRREYKNVFKLIVSSNGNYLLLFKFLDSKDKRKEILLLNLENRQEKNLGVFKNAAFDE